MHRTMRYMRCCWVLSSIMKKIITVFSLCGVLAIVLVLCITYTFAWFLSDLPNYEQLARYTPPTITRLYSTDMNIVAEYAQERRIFVPYEKIPPMVISAFLASEDKNFFDHQGIDFFSIFRAMLQNAFNFLDLQGKNGHLIGGSTITQQVVKVFLLSNEKSFVRKLQEAVLAYRLSKAYSKEKILELYLNQIFLGHNSYGIAAAAQDYFDKELDDLDVAEVALLASLPKSPSSLNPFAHYAKAIGRRNWVIERMAKEGFITQEEALKYISTPINLRLREEDNDTGEKFYTETVKQWLCKWCGEKSIYADGLSVNTNLNDKLQRIADSTLKSGLIAYDRAHGWRGPLGTIQVTSNWEIDLRQFLARNDKLYTGDYRAAVVLNIKRAEAIIGLQNGTRGVIKLDKLSWARRETPKGLSSVVKSVESVLKVGDIVLVRSVPPSSGKAANISDMKNMIQYSLEQIPEVNGAMVVLEPYSGKVLALVGGYSFHSTYFNRATQAKRQPGSAFKTFIYLSALENGYTSEDILIDEPITLKRGRRSQLWQPQNFTRDFIGPMSLRAAFAQSRNIPAIKLAISLGLERVLGTATRLGVYSQVPHTNYAMALGTFETTLLDITNAYNVFASGGLKTTPKFVDSVYDRDGNLLYSDSNITCFNCESTDSDSAPEVVYFMERVVAEDDNRGIVSLLEEVVNHGTARRALSLGKSIAGKTGTTNGSNDVWFLGFSSTLTVGLYIGFDTPKGLGTKESGAHTALPIFVDFMKQVLRDKPNEVLGAKPRGIRIAEFGYMSSKSIESDNHSEKLLWNEPGSIDDTGEDDFAISESTSEVVEGESKQSKDNVFSSLMSSDGD